MRTIFLIIGFLGAMNAAAVENDQLRECREVSDDVLRLVCYDALTVETVPEEPAATPAPVAVTATTAAVATEQATAPEPASDDFGQEFNVNEKAQTMTSSVIEVRKNAKGGLVLTLANDHVWQQSGSERLFVKEGQNVTVHRGAFSAFYLSVEGNGRRYRFARVR